MGDRERESWVTVKVQKGPLFLIKKKIHVDRRMGGEMVLLITKIYLYILLTLKKLIQNELIKTVIIVYVFENIYVKLKLIGFFLIKISLPF